MTGFLQTYPNARSTGRCAKTGQAFTAGQAIVAVLIESRKGLVRADYSLEAWLAGARPDEGVVGFWRCVHQQDEAPRDALLSDDELLDIFEQSAGVDGGADADAKQVRFRYVLALLLLRKRLLRGVGNRRENGVPVMLVERKGQPGETLRVVDPSMDELAIAEAVEQVGQLIGGNAGEQE